MNFVQPIRDPNVIEGIKEYLRFNNQRNYIFFCLGIYSGLRVADLLDLRVGMVRGTHIKIIEGKTRKEKKFIIHPVLKPELDLFIAGKQDNDFLFPSRQKKKKSNIKNRPIHRSMAYKMLNKVAHRFNLSEIGCHTMRKTFGYHLYMQDARRLALLMKLFNHSSESVTLLYLGLTQDVMDAAISKLSYP